MPQLPAYLGPYPSHESFAATWRAWAAASGARETVVGRSVEGRPILRYEVGAADGPAVLLTGLMHGVEYIGALALLDVVRALTEDTARADVLARARLVVLPVVNPDAFAANLARLARGRSAHARGNARGVDLNRNFPVLTSRAPRSPFAGSQLHASPYYAGPHAFSEPETCAVRDVARAARPALALGFHSFGNMLLYPWGFTHAPHPRTDEYCALGNAFARALPTTPYQVKPSARLYPVVGDLDDWLDATFDTRAFTVEISQLDRRMLDPRRLLNPFCWMNPTAVDTTVANLTPGVVALVRRALAPADAPADRALGTAAAPRPIDLAAH